MRLRRIGAGLSANRAGFTLIEIMVVVVILGILAALVVPRVMSRPDEARAVAARQDIKTLVQSLKLYKLDNYKYPTMEQGLQALAQKPGGADNWKAYLDYVPKDPWGNEYQYLNPGTHGNEVEVFCFGADGKQGGEGVEADIGSWMR
jgi:general secretion pathway protein G